MIVRNISGSILNFYYNFREIKLGPNQFFEVYSLKPEDTIDIRQLLKKGLLEIASEEFENYNFNGDGQVKNSHFSNIASNEEKFKNIKIKKENK